MSTPLVNESITRIRNGWSTIYCSPGVSANSIISVLAEPGDTLKSSPKSAVRRCGEVVIKESRLAGGTGPFKHTFKRARYRQGWIAAHHLLRHGISVPEPLAYIERGGLGIITGNALVSSYLGGQQNVENFLNVLIQRKAGADTIHVFLSALAQAINAFTDAGARHGDLSGKNIFTADGRHFSFIDLDDVTIEEAYGEGLRMKNHVQLYDSFCDLLSDSVLVPFITKLLTQEQDLRVWMPRVREAQIQRRELVEERWAREGRNGSAG